MGFVNFVGFDGGVLLYERKQGIMYFSITSRDVLEELILCLEYALRPEHRVHDDTRTHHPFKKGAIPGECAECGWLNKDSAFVTTNITMYTVISLALVYLGRRYNEGAGEVKCEMHLDIHGLLSHFSTS